jgi:hypothetical protein
MKIFKFITGFLLLAAAFLTEGCSKKLDLLPYNQFVDATAFDTKDRCVLALNGVYDAAQSGVYDPLNGGALQVRGYPFGAAAIEQSEMRGEDMINVAQFFLITYTSTYTPVSPNNVNMWSQLYALINKANLSIDGFRAALGKNVLTAAEAAQYEAECRFLRALAHHELVINFARPYLDGNGSKMGVPYRDYAVASSASLEQVRTQKRDSVSVVYAKMLLDLDYAENNLPASQTGVNTIRATKAAAIALKMRLKMHKGDWAGVIAEGNKLIPATINPLSPSSVVSPIGNWSLPASPDGAFTNNLSSESIFSIKNDANDNPGVNAALAQLLGPANAGTGRGLVAISPTIWNLPSWRCDDTRRTLLARTGVNNGNNSNYFTLKYRDYAGRSDFAPIIRYADVLLMQAEAEARQASGVSQRAIDLLNTVRNRAIPNPATNQYVAANFATKNDLIKAILDERRIEFCAEGRRWADIHRLVMDPNFSTNGIPAKVASGFGNLAGYSCGGAVTYGIAAIPYADYRFLWPIPQEERNQNPIIDQNPGY